jgi:hypothetical protein
LIVASLVSLLFFALTGPASAATCSGGIDYYQYTREVGNRAYWGIEGNIGTPTVYSLHDIYHDQMLNGFDILDASVNYPFEGCFKSNCHIQVGDIYGSIGNAWTGTVLTTSSMQPYVEMYDKVYADVEIVYSYYAGPAYSFFNIFDTGIVDSEGYHWLQADFDNRVGSGNQIISGGWFLQGANYQITAQSEYSNTSSTGNCPYFQHQEWGTYGYGTYHDFYSRVDLYSYPDHTWGDWGYWVTGTQTSGPDGPYYAGWFVPYGAWNVETSG